MKKVTIDKETIESVRNMDIEIRLQELKETIDRIFGRCIYGASTYLGGIKHIEESQEHWSDEDVAKLDYILCEMEIAIGNSRDVKMKIVD